MNVRNLWRRLRRITLRDTLNQLKSADVLLFCHDADRGLTLEGKAYSPLIDSVREDLNARGFTCEVVALQWSSLVGDLAHGNPKAMNASYLRGTLVWRLGRMVGLYQRYKEPLIAVFSGILAQARPRCVISIGSSAEMAIACRRAGITQAELLHGLGYSIIPWNWDVYPTESVPPVILSLDGTSTTTFAALAGSGVQVHQIPHPFLKRFVSDEMRERLPPEWLSLTPPPSQRRKRNVLVALNWGYAGDHGEEVGLDGLLNNGLFPDVLSAVVGDTVSDTQWLFRFHPVQLRNQDVYAKLFSFMDRFCAEHPNADWKWASHIPLPQALQHASAVVTMQSMSAYEAAAMGVPTLALCPSVRPGGKYSGTFADLVAAGYVTKSDWSRQGIVDWLRATETLAPLPGWRGDEAAWNQIVDLLLGQRKAGWN